MNPFLRVLGAILATAGAAAFGLFFLTNSSPDWYDALAKPAALTPLWSFIPVWLVMYACLAASMIIIWVINRQTLETDTWGRFYYIQLLFNASWMFFFFGLHALLIALIAIICLAFLTLCLLMGAWNTDRRAALFLTPYFAWIIYTGFLNAMIWYLN